MVAGQIIRNYDVGFARWLLFNSAIADDGSPAGTFHDCKWMRIGESCAIKVTIGLHIQLVNGFRFMDIEYQDIQAAQGINFDILYGEDHRDFMQRPFTGDSSSWYTTTQTGLPGKQPQIWG